MTRVLIVDDDGELCELLDEYLSSEGFSVSTVRDGKSGLDEARRFAPDLVVLDVMMPKMNGFDVLRSLRSDSELPVIMLTARRDEVDRIVGLELGADDYLPKPFNPRELVARIRAVLRRTSSIASTTGSRERIELVDVSLDLGSQSVTCAGEPVHLTAVEFKLLEVLIRRAGSVIKREELSSTVLGRNLTRFDRAIDMHVSNLRKKLGHYHAGVERIRTIRGRGYLYTVPSAKEDA